MIWLVKYIYKNMIKQWNGVIPAALYIRACLQGGGEPQAGEVTRLRGVEKQPFFTCNLATPPSRGALSQDYWMVAKHENKKNAGKRLVLVINALLHSSCCSCCNLQCCGFLLLPLIMMQRHRQSEFSMNLMFHESDPGKAGYPTLNVYMAKFGPGWEGYPVWQIGLPALAGHPT